MKTFIRILRRAGLIGFAVAFFACPLAAPAQAQIDPGYRYQSRVPDVRAVRPSAPYYYYRPRVIARGAPETRIERDPPAILSRRYDRIDRGSRARRESFRRRCPLVAKSARRGASVRFYGEQPGC